MSATHQAVLLLSLLSCLTTAIGVPLALRLRENARAIAAGRARLPADHDGRPR